MADLTIGEVGIILQATLQSVDNTTIPPTIGPLDLTGATITLLFAIADTNERPKAPRTVLMSIVDAPNGVVQYVFQAGDLVQPPEMGKFGVFRYSIKVVYPSGKILYTDTNGLLTIKGDAQL
jgi:hypothetical protein